ncbi:MAG: UDP-N-acetylmuramyl-tripeptide synthetase [Clostridia bacterium]|nr:UDP-N-acetylmuramyl-tripeptide synthetase [Clostridia bacterium]
MKHIREYLEYLKSLDLVSDYSIPVDVLSKDVKKVTYDSRLVEEGTLFICKGKNFKDVYLYDSFDKGAVIYVAERVIVSDKPYIIVNDMRMAITKISGFFYDYSWNNGLVKIGLTGTKGKSTTAVFTKAIIDCYAKANGEPLCGFNSGIFNFDGDKKISATMTTPETLELHATLDGCVKNGLKYHVMESSSQGLKYKRTEDLKYRYCAFLTFGQDHISENEHPTIEDYFESKLKIFSQSDIAVVNNEIEKEYLDRIMKTAEKECKEVHTFGLKEGAEYYGYDIKSTPSDVTFKVKYHGKVEELRVSIGGYYNAINALCAIAITDHIGIPFEYVREALKDVRVPGRMEVLQFRNKKVDAVIDEAHNALGATTLLTSLKELYPDRGIMIVFGAAGNRARNRRKDLGEVANRFADKVILTENDPGFEKAWDIAQEIAENIDKDKIITYIDNRVEAIRYACEIIPDNYVLVAMGMGAAAAQKHGAQFDPIPCDYDLIKEYIETH